MSSKIIPDRYEHNGTILSGGQGDVFICRDKNLERDVAIKFIRNVEEIDRLLSEIAILQSLRSSYVVEIFDIIRDPETKEIGLVEEFIAGRDLTSVVEDVHRGENLDVEELLKILYQIASGIADIHEVNIVHRDIKLNNMKFDSEGFVKLFDFGLAKILGPDAKTKGFKGTLGYAPAELFVESQSTVGIKKSVDVFSFGITAWLLGTGDFPGGQKMTPPVAIADSIGTTCSELPSEVCEVIDACVAFDPDDRPEMAKVRDVLGDRLNYEKHRGILSTAGHTYEVNKTARAVKIELGNRGSATISYDGLVFYITPISGSVVVNNIHIQINNKSELPGASVIAFGDPAVPQLRHFVTFDISHPEVVI